MIPNGQKIERGTFEDWWKPFEKEDWWKPFEKEDWWKPFEKEDDCLDFEEKEPDQFFSIDFMEDEYLDNYKQTGRLIK